MSSVKKSFNRAAQTYDKHAFIQKEMAKDLVRMEKEPTSIQRILEIGCGTGMLTHLLHTTHPQTPIDAMDISPKMVSLAKENIFSPNVSFFLQDAESKEWGKSSTYDLIISNAAFQWFKQPKETIQRLALKLNPKGRLLISTFGPDTFIELITLFQKVEKELGLPTYSHHLPMKEASSWTHFFKEADLTQLELIEKKVKVFYPNCRTFLRSIKAIGASFSQSKHPLLVQKKVLQEVMRKYDLRYGLNGSVYATYHLIYLCGKC